MNLASILILVLVGLAVVAALYVRHRTTHHGSSCSCCDGCSLSSKCNDKR